MGKSKNERKRWAPFLLALLILAFPVGMTLLFGIPVLFLVIWLPLVVGKAGPHFMFGWVTIAILLAVISVKKTDDRPDLRGWRMVGLGLSAFIIILQGLVFPAKSAYHRWKSHLVQESCGVKPGMTKSQVSELARSCGRRVTEGRDYYSIAPPFLAGLGSEHLFLVSGLRVTYDKEGNVKEARGHASDF